MDNRSHPKPEPRRGSHHESARTMMLAGLVPLIVIIAAVIILA